MVYAPNSLTEQAAFKGCSDLKVQFPSSYYNTLYCNGLMGVPAKNMAQLALVGGNTIPAGSILNEALSPECSP